MATKQAKKPARPTQEFRLGRIGAAIWANESEAGIRHNVTVSRLYKDDDDQWKDSTSFGRDDLPLVAKVLDRCHTWIFTEGNANGHSNGDTQTNSNGHSSQREHEDTPF